MDPKKDKEKQEFQYLSRCLSKNSKLEDFEYSFPKGSQDAFQELMNEGKIYPKVTKLHVPLTRTLSRDGARNFADHHDDDNEEIGEDEGNDENEEDDEEDSDDKPEKIKSLPLNTKTSDPSFRFHIFSNLKALEIKAQKLDKKLYPDFGSSLAEAFEDLHYLKKLYLKLSSHPPGTDFILQGLLKLPLLTSLSLRIDSMSLSQGDILNTFIKKQANLASMSLEIKCSTTDELQENQFLENFLESHSHKPLLKHLTLNLNSWEAEYLSEGLKRLQGSDQIKAFELKIREFIDCRPREKSFAGLCDFLLRNRNTLDDLALDLALEPLYEVEMYDSMNSVIPQLTQLQHFDLRFYLNEHKMTRYLFDLDLKSILLKLENLQRVVLNLDYLSEFPPECREWMVECFTVLPLLKSLRKLEFSIPIEGLSRTEINMITMGLKGLNRFVKMEFLNIDDLGFYEKETEEIVKVYWDVVELQALL